MEMSISANGVFYLELIESVLSIILKKWFDERVLYKNEMKKAYKSGNKELGAAFHMKQYTNENFILLNSLYGATALGSFRYGNVFYLNQLLKWTKNYQESALTANRHINKVMKGERKKYGIRFTWV